MEETNQQELEDHPVVANLVKAEYSSAVAGLYPHEHEMMDTKECCREIRHGLPIFWNDSCSS